MTRAKDISKILTDADFSGTLDVTGAVTAGSVAISDDNNYSFGDGTTYIQGSGAADRLKFITNASEAMRIDSSGKVGIGTSIPDEKLDVRGTLQVGVDGTTAGLIRFMDSGSVTEEATISSDANGGLIFGGNSGPGELIFRTGSSTERMRIDSSGNVGIGTASPNGNGLLTINAPTNNSPQIVFTENDTAKWLIGHRHDGDHFRFYDLANSAERMRIDASGNVGIGLSSPQELLHLKDGSIAVGNGTASNNTVIGRIGFSTDASNSRFIGIESFRGGDAANADLRFHTFGGDGNSGERMRIDTSGNLLVGTLSVFSGSGIVPLVSITKSGGDAIGITSLGSSKVALATRPSANHNYYAGYFLNLAGTGVGNITVSPSSTAYNTSSDYRLKENVTTDWDATTRLKQLNPVRFNFIADADTTVDGFLAHEVQSVVPEAITGTHNEVDDDGNPVYQGIDQSKLVPLLVKTIQELEARIVALETA